MRSLLVLLLLGSAAGGVTVEERIAVLVEAPSREVFVGERVEVELTLCLDRDWSTGSLVRIFRRPVDLPLHVRAPWLVELAGAEFLPAPPETDGARVALNDRVVRWTEGTGFLDEGREIRTLSVRRALVPTRPGELTLDASVLLAYATRFEEDLLQGRRPVDRREASVWAAPVVLRVRPLPEEGRPAAFSGAIGRFEISAAVDAREVRIGESFRLTLAIEGEGNLTRFETPLLVLDGFHVVGRIDDHGEPRRSIEYEVVALESAPDAVPPLPFAYLDPEPPGRYREVRTAAIPLRVTGRKTAPAGGATEPTVKRDGSLLVILSIAAALLVVLGVGVVLLRRTRREPPPDPAEERTRAAGAALRAALEEADGDAADALAEYLAARLGCAPAAVISPDLADRLRDVGVAEGPAGRAASLLERLVGARYGGQKTDGAREEGRALLRELEDQPDAPA
jgi:hypothetical protein